MSRRPIAEVRVRNDKARIPPVVGTGTRALPVNRPQRTASPLVLNGSRPGCAGIERETK